MAVKPPIKRTGKASRNARSKQLGIKKSAAAKKSAASESGGMRRKSARGAHSNETIGKYEIIITSGQGLQCGAFALEHSTSSQLGSNLPTLTPERFAKILESAESKAWHEDRNWVGDEYQRNYVDDQLALVLYLWGLRHGKRLHLGLVAEGWSAGVEMAFPVLVPVADTNHQSVIPSDDMSEGTVWIHNDNAILISGRPYNHYSGIKICTPD